MADITIQETIPYTYLIGWSTLNKWYYGVRYAKGCSPTDLFNPYRTSSKKVHKYIEKYGLPEIIEIRKTFKNVNDARLWESKVLKKLNVNHNDNWLNQTTNMGISEESSFRCSNHFWIHNSEKEKFIKNTDEIPDGWKKGRKSFNNNRKDYVCTEQTKLKISLKNKNRPKPPGFGEHISRARKGTRLSPETIQKIKDTKSKQYITPSAKNFVFLYQGEQVEIFNLYKYCEKNNLQYSCMLDVDKGRQKSHKGYAKA